jgi:hypothetical protein
MTDAQLNLLRFVAQVLLDNAQMGAVDHADLTNAFAEVEFEAFSPKSES